MRIKSLKRMEDELVKRFIDVLILARLRDESRLSGYDIIGFVNKEFDVFVSPGKVYSVLYTLERNGLVRGVYDEKRRVWVLTDEGEEVVERFGEVSKGFLKHLVNLLS